VASPRAIANGAHDWIHRQSEALLGPLCRLVHVAARHFADDDNVDVIRRGARDALVAGSPRPVDRHGGRAERSESSPMTNRGPNASETSSVSGRVYRLAGLAETAGSARRVAPGSGRSWTGVSPRAAPL